MRIKILFFLLAFGFSISSFAQQPSVYKTDTGKKYHKTSCRYLNHSKTEITLEKALQLGLEACKVCRPIKAKFSEASNATTKSVPVKRNTTASQCTGKTKSGRRCKRRTKNASGRCYQH